MTPLKQCGLRWDGNRDLKKRIVKNGNRKLIFSLFQWSDSTNSYSGKTKAFRFVVWNRSIPLSEISNFRLLFVISGTFLYFLSYLSLGIIFLFACVTLKETTILNLSISIYEKYLHLPKQLKPQTSNLICVFSYKVFLWIRLINHLQINAVNQNPLNTDTSGTGPLTWIHIRELN